MAEDSSRHKKLALLQAAFPEFIPFLMATMKWLGFNCTDMQRDIGAYLQYGPKDLMVQAQRGEAKTTITAIFCIWCIIHNPKLRVLIVSAGGTQANEISTLICRIILNMDILECLRPDPRAGDRVSVEHFDVHYSLKGVDKSPSVACVGVTSNLQGKRAHLLIADDVESQKNSRTEMMREQLLQAIRDFPSIVSDGRVLFLGTPQTESSVYNSLAASGYGIRIWPGRYPTDLNVYGGALAPFILARLAANPELGTGGGIDRTLGQPTDPDLFDEENLTKKEAKQGRSFFMLQHMLCTKLADAARYPLKPHHLIVMRLGDELPLNVIRGMTHEHQQQYRVGQTTFNVSTPQYVSQELARPSGRVLHLDPAGGGANGDETGSCVADALNGAIFLRSVKGFAGGYAPETIASMVDYIVQWNPDVVQIEKNFGYGALTAILLPLLRAAKWQGKIVDSWSSGQKEVRIADTLEPILGRGKLIVDESVLTDDWESTQMYPIDKRNSYALMHQFTKLTRDRKSLSHDDRIDAVGGAVGYWVRTLSIDSMLKEEELRQKVINDWMADPLQHNRYSNHSTTTRKSTIRRKRP